MHIKPPDHVRELIDAGTISEAQWTLFRLGDEALAEDKDRRKVVTLHLGETKIGASNLGLDGQAPGIIFAGREDGGSTYVDWTKLTAVTVPD